jgi:hypothetical protein
MDGFGRVLTMLADPNSGDCDRGFCFPVYAALFARGVAFPGGLEAAALQAIEFDRHDPIVGFFVFNPLFPLQRLHDFELFEGAEGFVLGEAEVCYCPAEIPVGGS